MLPVGIYPYMNLEDLNLDYILKKLMKLETDVQDFVEMNAIKYADPIQWNITTQYEKNTIVIDPATGSAYLSVRPVPAGIDISRTEYWSEVFNLSALIQDAVRNLTEHDAGISTVATFSSDPGEWVMWKDILYVATSQITPGDAYTVGGNIARLTVEAAIKSVVALIGQNAQAIAAEAETRAREIAAEAEARTQAIAEESVERNQAISDALETIKHAANWAEDFGAIGDGDTDDTAAIQMAVNEAEIVYFNNTYKITAPINVPAGRTLAGNGTIIVDGIIDGFVLSSDCRVVGLSFTQPSLTLEAIGSIIGGNEISNVEVVGCRFNNIFSGYCIQFTLSRFITIEYNDISNYSFAGIMLIDGCQHAKVNHNRVYNGRGGTSGNRYAISVSGYFQTATRIAQFIECSYNYIEDVAPLWEGIDSHGVTHAEFIGNIIIGTAIGISLGDPTTPEPFSNTNLNVRIIGNRIRTNDNDTGRAACIIFNNRVSQLRNVEIAYNDLQPYFRGASATDGSLESVICLRQTTPAVHWNVNIHDNIIVGSGAHGGINIGSGAYLLNVNIERNTIRGVDIAINMNEHTLGLQNVAIKENQIIAGTYAANFANIASWTNDLIDWSGNSQNTMNTDLYTTAPRAALTAGTRARGRNGQFIPNTAAGTVAGWLCISPNNWVAVTSSVA